MEELFPIADHFVTEFGFDKGPRKWNTEVFFGGRYTLTMQVDVEIDYEARRIIRLVGEPVFYLQEVENITLLPDGRAVAVYSIRSQRDKPFGLLEWNKIYKAKGDLSVIGFKTIATGVQHFDEHVLQIRRPRIAVSLLKE